VRMGPCAKDLPTASYHPILPSIRGRLALVETGVKGALFRNDRLLRLHRRDDLGLWPGLWDLPGGGVEKDGTLLRTLLREVLEETGFAVRVGHVLDVSFDWVKVRAEPRFPSVVVIFRCSTSRGPLLGVILPSTPTLHGSIGGI
jgi:8-oxo-dGTP pyrophosphatase MutT (NUDIX family)